MRIEQHAGTRPDEIGRACQEAATGTAIALQGGDGELTVGADDRFGEIVDGVDVRPRLVGRRVGGFDLLQVDAVRPEVAPTHQDDDADRPLAHPVVGRLQAPALTRAHGAVVEVEMQEAHPPASS
jgi:hypothetical protein